MTENKQLYVIWFDFLPRSQLNTKSPPTFLLRPHPTYRVDLQREDEPFDGEPSSPFEGTKVLVSNLHPVVVEEDILV